MRTDVPEIGTLLGYAMSDMWLESNPERGHYRISMASQSEELIRDLEKVLRKLGFDGREGSPEPHVNYNEQKKVYQLNLASKELYDFITGLTREDVRRYAFKYPKEYIRSVFDGDGSVSKVRPGRLSVRYGVSAKWLVTLFKEVLEKERGYHTTMWRSGDVYYCAVNNQDQVQDFLKWVDPIYKRPKYFLKWVDPIYKRPK